MPERRETEGESRPPLAIPNDSKPTSRLALIGDVSGSNGLVDEVVPALIAALVNPNPFAAAAQTS